MAFVARNIFSENFKNEKQCCSSSKNVPREDATKGVNEDSAQDLFENSRELNLARRLEFCEIVVCVFVCFVNPPTPGP